ncbi:site-specific DNA-methyltransferase [Treponema pedis]|uniref:site-specific DNA-methyltransferase n=2 Tax=Treponema pedis TaxID=409322 RepID=UPI0003FFC95D|nr:site-specific DNA-methyltransferase [Treponema pedis]
MSQKLELTWYGKDTPVKVEPRILIKDDKNSNPGKDGITDNLLIHGDNLLALKALEQTYTGTVKCIYIDPPYNTGTAFEHYDDNLEHSTWLTLMKPRLEILRNLLSEDGSIWISIDDDEGHYLKVLCDEIFGRNNFINTVIWEKKFSPQNDAKWLSDSHDFILVYAKFKEVWRPNLLPRTEEMDKRYSNPDNDSRGIWASLPLQAKSGADSDFTHVFSNGVKWSPPSGRFSAFSHESLEEMEKDNRIWFGKKEKMFQDIKNF